MTGAERLEQVRRALHVPWRKATDEALAALDGCVLLTAEEAEKVREALSEGMPPSPGSPRRDLTRPALAILSPERSNDD